MNERGCYIALNMMSRIGPVCVRSLIEALGSVGAVFNADKTDLVKARGVGPDLADHIIDQREKIDWQSEVERAEKNDIRIITAIDAEYPKQLLEIHDPPLALYVMGAFQARDKNAFGVVGTRKPTYYGKDVTAMITNQLVRAGYTIVSGLAHGVDTIAHDVTVKANGRTIAVIGSGLDCIYPAENIPLAERIAKNGAVISEFPFGRQPDKTTFPIRNRIISGLSMGVIVMEAGLQSGAMITARQALEQGRNLFAVPGKIDSSASRGPNKLIKEGAKLVESAEDVLADYEFFIPDLAGKKSSRQMPLVLSKEEELIMHNLEGGEKCVDALIRETGIKPADMGAILVGMEMKRIVRMLPGQMVAMSVREV